MEQVGLMLFYRGELGHESEKKGRNHKGGAVKAKRPNPARKKTSTNNMMEAQSRQAAYQRVLRLADPVEQRLGELCFQRTYIDKELLAKEASLLSTRWVGSRYMSPLRATQAFTDAYIAAYRAAWARYFDATEAPHKQPVRLSFALNDRADMTSLWQARQKADELGMPYDLFCEIVIEQWLDGRKTKNPPLPNQLCSGKLFPAWMRGHPTWDEMGERLYRQDWDQRFFIDPVGADPVHAAALRALHADVLRAKDRPARLARYLGTDGPLTPPRAVSMFDASLVRDARALASNAAEPTVTAHTHEAYVPACIGSRSSLAGAPCHNCAFAAECSAVKRKVTRALGAAGASGDPRADRRRQQNRESQRKSRDKKRDQPVA